MTAPEPDAGLLAYFADRERRRHNRVYATWNALSPSEQRLVKEAAVMGYVQAVRGHGPHDAKIPKDSAVVAAVIDAIHANDDKFPYIAGLTRRRKAKP